jgi:arylsulfatase A-like enzyme
MLICPLRTQAAGKAAHVVVVVWDGMRPDLVSEQHTPTLWRLAREGARFANHHSAYLTSTEVNGATIATGDYPGHSGIIANRLYLPAANPLVPVDTQDSEVINKLDRATGGAYLPCPTMAETLQAAGRRTVVAGTKPVAILQDRRQRSDSAALGAAVYAGESLPAAVGRRLVNQLGPFPTAIDSKSLSPSERRNEWTTRAVLGPLWTNGLPALTLLWLSEPDASQHSDGPGSPKGLAAIASADRSLAAVLAEIDRRGLRDRTDVFVVSDHGFSTVERTVDVCAVLSKAGFPAARVYASGSKPGDILVVGQGGSVLFYVMEHEAGTVGKLVRFLQQQDFVGALFTREPAAGTFTLEQANLNAAEAPDVVMALRWSAGTNAFGLPGMLVTDGTGSARSGMHASLSRFDVHNLLVGAGPDFKAGFADSLPTGNTDLAPTILWLLGVEPKQPMDGRVLSEALTVEAPAVSQPATRRLEAVQTNERTVWRQTLQISEVNRTIYLDEASGSLTPRAP